MTTTPQKKPAATPDIPKEFGDDGGHFYKHYDELAGEIDEDLVNRLKSQLDGILIFAGLFAGVNSAFLALTLPQMSPNPADDTNALLLGIALGDNSNITSAADLPSASFKSPPRIYAINALFSVSLALALFSSFLAVLGQQWLVYYRKRGGGGPEYQRWEQLRRYLAAKQWKFEMVLDALVPGMLQLGLTIFCISFALYLGTLSQSLNRIIVALLCVAGAILIALSTFVAFDPWCPFQLPWSHIVRPAVCATAAVVKWLAMCGGAAAAFILRSGIVAGRVIMCCCRRDMEAEGTWKDVRGSELGELVKTWRTGPADTYREFLKVALKSPESPDTLKIIALQRVICTSEDRNAWFYSALNLQSIRDQRALSSLAKDVEFCTRLIGLYRAALYDSERGQNGRPDAKMKALVLSASFSHLLLMASSVPTLTWSTTRMNPSQVIRLDNRPITPSQIRYLNEGNSISSTMSWYESFDSVNLRFCIRVVQLCVEGLNSPRPTNFNAAIRGTIGALKRAEDLRLGCVVGSVILSAKEWCDVTPLSLGTWPLTKPLQELFDAYRTSDEWEMFRTISEALTTARDKWELKPHHEIYAQLFKLRLSRFDAPLLSIERQIRDQTASETGRLRALQARCVRMVADSLDASEYSFTKDLVYAPLERYIDSITELMELDPARLENSGTADLLQDIKLTFWEQIPVKKPAHEEDHEQQEDPEYRAYSKVDQLLTWWSNVYKEQNAV